MSSTTLKSERGKHYGRLTVIARAPNDDGLSVAARWHCLCSCGSRTVVTGAALRRGSTRSCGCFAIEARQERWERQLAARKAWFAFHRMQAGGALVPADFHLYSGWLLDDVLLDEPGWGVAHPDPTPLITHDEFEQYIAANRERWLHEFELEWGDVTYPYRLPVGSDYGDFFEPVKTIEFDFVFVSDKWGVSMPVLGTLAVGSGASLWVAIEACLEDEPRARRFAERSRRYIEKYLANERNTMSNFTKFYWSSNMIRGIIVDGPEAWQKVIFANKGQYTIDDLLDAKMETDPLPTRLMSSFGFGARYHGPTTLRHWASHQTMDLKA